MRYQINIKQGGHEVNKIKEKPFIVGRDIVSFTETGVYCYYCDKILDDKKGEIDHGCLECCDSIQADRIDDRDQQIIKLQLKLSQSIEREGKSRECLSECEVFLHGYSAHGNTSPFDTKMARALRKVCLKQIVEQKESGY